MISKVCFINICVYVYVNELILRFYVYENELFQNYEIRKYYLVKWVSIAVQSMEYEKVRSVGFQRLFQYIIGENKLGMFYGKCLLLCNFFFFLEL